MHTSILIFHIIAMSASVGLMTLAAGSLFLNTAVAARLARGGFFTTVSGVAAGFVLLLGSPVGTECVVLTTYLAAVALSYRYVFGMGIAEKCWQPTR